MPTLEERRERAGEVDLKLGKWETVLVDAFDGTPIACNALISDPPFSRRTHEKSRSSRSDGSPTENQAPDYQCWTGDDVVAFVKRWSPAVDGWIACQTSHDLIPAWEAAYDDAGRHKFAPVPCCMSGMTCRLRGDGPASWATYLMAARPKGEAWASWGALPGFYVGPSSRESGQGRGKPLWLMRAIVGHYSRPFDLVVDPLAGWGSTLIAAGGMHRQAIGAEMDPKAYTKAMKNIRRGVQMDLIYGDRPDDG